MSITYDKIGVDYNLTRTADPYLTERFIHYLDPQPGEKYLDIGCGTGNYTQAFFRQGFDFSGIDPSIEMLNKARDQYPGITFELGSAEELKLPSESIQGISACLTVHHWSDLEKAFASIHRVLKNDGRIVIFTSTPEQMQGYWLNHYFPKMMDASILQMPALDRIASALGKSGMKLTGTENYFIKPDLKDLFLYCGKHNPDQYFNGQIRNGISSFAALAHQEEVNAGLAKLRMDINSGEIKDVMHHYRNDLGDYQFVMAQKTT